MFETNLWKVLGVRTSQNHWLNYQTLMFVFKVFVFVAKHYCVLESYWWGKDKAKWDLSFSKNSKKSWSNREIVLIIWKLFFFFSSHACVPDSLSEKPNEAIFRICWHNSYVATFKTEPLQHNQRLCLHWNVLRQ